MRKATRVATLAVLLAAGAPHPASAFGWPVVDVAQLLKHAAQYVTEKLQLDEESSIYAYYRRFARRMWLFRSPERYHLEGPPRVRTWRHDDPAPESFALLDALNRGVSPSILLAFSDWDADPEGGIPAVLAASRAALAARDSVLLNAIDQTGRWRAARKAERVRLNELEHDVIETEGSATTRLGVLTAARLTALRQQEDRINLVGALSEQLIVEEIARRESEALAQQIRQDTLTRPTPDRSRLTADLMSSWRQP